MNLNCPIEDIEKVTEVCITSCQQLLHTQTPWGEWGKGHAVRLDRDAAIDRLSLRFAETLVAKPNVYRTLGAIQVLRTFHKNKFKNRSDLAWGWISSHLDGPRFRPWNVSPGDDGDDELGSLRAIDKVDDIRHTAQALLFKLHHTNSLFLLPQGLEFLLDNQDEKLGAWPQTPGGRPDIRATAYSAEFLLSFPFRKFEDSILTSTKKLQKQELQSRVRESSLRAINWINERAAEGKQEDIQRMSHALYRLAPLLRKERLTHVAGTIIRGVLRPEFADKLSYVNLTRYVCGLAAGRRMGIDHHEGHFTFLCTKLIDEFDHRNLDAPDYIWLLETFKDDRRIINTVSEYPFDDYLMSCRHGRTVRDREDNVNLLLGWLQDSLLRIENLKPGVRIGAEGYRYVYEDERQKVELILDKLRDLDVEKKCEEFILLTRQIVNTPDSSEIHKALIKLQPTTPTQEIPQTSIMSKMLNEIRAQAPSEAVRITIRFIVEGLRQVLF